MKLTSLAFLMMATGAIAALVFAAGPLDSSRVVQFCFTISIGLLLCGALVRRVGGRRHAIASDARGEIGQAMLALETLDRELEKILLASSESRSESLASQPVAKATLSKSQQGLSDSGTADVSAADACDMRRLHEWLEEKTKLPMQEFLSHRQALLDGIGIGPFAELMIRFARAERSINRCLSASSDGDEKEAFDCLVQASQRMQRCLDTFHNYAPLQFKNGPS